ncbi:hypothetical protein N308_09980, partial [Struthio camelus australis]
VIGRANIKGSERDITMNTQTLQASYHCDNSSDNSCLKFEKSKES